MKDQTRQKATYLGVGVGFVLFAIYGLLPGSFLGGVAGLGLAGALLGTPVEAGIIARTMVAAGMLAGVMLSGLVFVSVSAVAGWLAGTLIDTVKRTGRAALAAGAR